MELCGCVDVPIQPAGASFFLCWLYPIWVLFLLFNITGSSPAWFVSKKKTILLKQRKAPSHLWVSWWEKKSASTGWSRHDGYIYNFEHIYNGWGLKKTYNMQVSDISMKWYENDLSFNAYQATKKDKLEGKRSRNLLKLTLRIEEEMNNRCIITKRGYQFH